MGDLKFSILQPDTDRGPWNVIIRGWVSNDDSSKFFLSVQEFSPDDDEVAKAMTAVLLSKREAAKLMIVLADWVVSND
jgi:hypothetical protein